MDYWVTFQEKQTLALIDAMPAAKFGFKPFKNVRTFGEQGKHLAAFNYMAAATMLGEPIPEGTGKEVGPDSVRTKEQIMAYVRGSYAALHRAAAAIDDTNTIIDATAVSPLGNQATRLGVAAEALIHAMDHYGQLVEYLRMNGLVPPGSR
jgi:hypothetical protein